MADTERGNHFEVVIARSFPGPEWRDELEANMRAKGFETTVYEDDPKAVWGIREIVDQNTDLVEEEAA